MRGLRSMCCPVSHGKYRPGGRVPDQWCVHQVRCLCQGLSHGAKYLDDPGYLYHKSELEEIYARPAKNETFL